MLSITFQKGLKENAFPKAGLRQLQALFVLKGHLLMMNKTFPFQPAKTIYPRLQRQAATGVGTAGPPDLNCCPVLYLYLPLQVSKLTASEKSSKIQMRNSPNDPQRLTLCSPISNLEQSVTHCPNHTLENACVHYRHDGNSKLTLTNSKTFIVNNTIKLPPTN